jgi:phospho-N-acetylmuramoyl-pentapeptide-transferase
VLFHLLYRMLGDEVGWLRIFRYTSTRILAAAITALFLSFVIGPWFIEKLKARQIGETIRDDGPETHKKKAGTPTMGGSLIILCVAASTLLWCDLTNRFVWLALTVTVAFGAIGFADDYLKVVRRKNKGLSAKGKLALQCAVALGVAWALFELPIEPLLTFPFFKKLVIDLGPFYALLVVVVLVGCSNAVNLTDGLDGLAIGATLVVAATYAIFTYIAGNRVAAEYLQVASVPGVGEVAVFCTALVGASLGFLWWNSHPAQVFMGDVGSLAIGGAIGTVALLAKQEAILVLVGGLFVLEALSVILQVASFKLRGKRVFRMAPLHHHFELAGWKEPQIIVRFWILAILFALLSLSTLKLR